MSANHPSFQPRRCQTDCRAVLFLALVPVLAVAGCASSGSGSRGTDPAVGTSTIAMDDPSSPGLRRYLIHPPAAGISALAVPLLVVLHGGGSAPAAIEEETGFSAIADRERFVVVYPEATGHGGRRGWNAGFCCGEQAEDGVDDVGFVLRVVEHVAERLPVDRNRVYLVGYSEGGMLAHRIAAEHGGELAGLAVVAGAIGVRAAGDREPRTVPAPRVPLPVMIVHGLGDEVIPYRGTGDARSEQFADLDAAVGLWTAANGCGVAPTRQEERGGALHLSSYRGRAPVEVVALEGWGHDWPGRRAMAHLPAGSPLNGFDAGEAVWGFLARYSRGGVAAE